MTRIPALLTWRGENSATVIWSHKKLFTSQSDGNAIAMFTSCTADDLHPYANGGDTRWSFLQETWTRNLDRFTWPKLRGLPSRLCLKVSGSWKLHCVLFGARFFCTSFKILHVDKDNFFICVLDNRRGIHLNYMKVGLILILACLHFQTVCATVWSHLPKDCNCLDHHFVLFFKNNNIKLHHFI